MNRELMERTGEQLTLKSQLQDLTHLHDWIERLAARYAFREDLQFAMNLCLEEVLSNVIRHGYQSQPGNPIYIEFSNPEDGKFVFVVEDHAPLFNLLEVPLQPVFSSDDDRIGGQGIRLLREFSDSLAYEKFAAGNRLKITFLAESAIHSDNE